MADSITFWLNAAGRLPLLTDYEMRQLAAKRDKLEPNSKGYIKIVNKIATHNLLLVPRVISRYLAKRVGFTMNSEVVNDLLQQGYIGLRRAAEKFDPARGYKFSTYAVSWIFQAASRWHNSRDRTVYIPENVMTEFLYVHRNGERSKHVNGKIRQEHLDMARYCMDPVSIDRPTTGNSEDGTLVDFLSDDNRVLDIQPTDEDSAANRLRVLMEDCGLDNKTCTIVLDYSRLKRMASVAARAKLPHMECRRRYEAAIQAMKDKVQEREAARQRLIADRLSK